LYRLVAQKSSDGGGWTEWSASTLHRGLSWVGIRSTETEEQIREAIIARFKTMDGGLLRWGQALLADIVSLVVSATISPFALFFFFRDGPRLKRELERVLPLDPGVAKRLFSEVR